MRRIATVRYAGRGGAVQALLAQLRRERPGELLRARQRPLHALEQGAAVLRFFRPLGYLEIMQKRR